MKRLIATLIVAVLLTTSVLPALAAEYTLGPGDQLLVRIENHPDMTMTITVAPDGYISFPLAGEIMAQGLTIPQLRDELTKKLSVNLANFMVSVVLVQARPVRVQVIGEVKVPGFQSLPQGSTAVQAIAQAGGPTEKADLENVLLTRKSGETVKINFKAVGKGDLSTDMTLNDGDTIIVAKGVIKVSVSGEVANPGTYEIPRGSGLIDAVAAAGGPKNTAQLQRISVYQGTGTEKAKPGSGERIFVGALGENPTMEDGYVVIVGRNHFWDATIVASIVTAIVAVIDLFVN